MNSRTILMTGMLACGVIQAQHEAPHPLIATGLGAHAEGAPLPWPEKGKPFSATVRVQTVQTFLDGTHVNRTTTTLEFRDMEGRVRSETLLPNGSVASVLIRDPVAGMVYRLNPAAKSATKEPIPAAPGHWEHSSGAPHAAFHPNGTEEDLGSSSVNGVMARGTRVVIVVPAGAIGNDREFRSVDEHWFSSEFNLIVKSVSTDPRFGTTTFERTNISRQIPNATLFQIPTGYTLAAHN